MAGMQIANDRPGDHHRRAGADALEKAEGDQGLHIRGKAASDAAEDKQAQAEIERRLAAESVGERPIDDLADGDRQEKAHQAHLHGAHIDLQFAGDGRERRQVHVDGEGSYGGEHPKDEGITQEGGLHRKGFRGPGFHEAGLRKRPGMGVGRAENGKVRGSRRRNAVGSSAHEPRFYAPPGSGQAKTSPFGGQ
jgi:hypothetical protein